MVYCGKPSLGCGQCRSKRLKCDQKRPGCGQCNNTGRKCFGYRDSNDLVFRDESQRVTTKVQRQAEAKRAKTKRLCNRKAVPDLSSNSTARLTDDSESPSQGQVLTSIQQPIVDVAINFLLGEYVRGSNFEYLPDLYNIDNANGVLSPIIGAVGLASLSLQNCMPELRNLAEKHHVDAIAKINHLLQREDTAQADCVLASILLLSLYETLSLSTNNSIDAWTTHMQGALTLAALRGPAQFNSSFGFKLFKQVAASIRVFCVQHRTRIPQQLRELIQIAKRSPYYDGVFFKSSHAAEAFTDLRADIAEGSISDSTVIIRRAEDVLRLVEKWPLELPPDLSYKIMTVHKQSAAIYGDYLLNFKDHYVAQLWNMMWMAEIALNSIIAMELSRMSDTPSPLRTNEIYDAFENNERQRSVAEAAENICGSVPQFFPADEYQCSKRKPRAAAMGYFLIWPLFTAGSSAFIEAETRSYIIDRLKFIADDLKLPQAQKAAEMLAHGNCTESWMHICHVF